jgi:hypothetical protein
VEVALLIRDRVKELRRVRASELRPSPQNWRTHPARQRDALKGLLAEIGYAGALLARETPNGLELIDGHLRAETTPDSLVPVLVLDVTEEEGRKLLATLDPIGAMATADGAKLDALLRSVASTNEPLTSLLADLAGSATTAILAEAAAPLEAEPEAEGEAEPESATSDYRTVPFVLTVPQEQTLRQALRAARSRYDAKSQGEAVYFLARDWLDAQRST